MYLTPANCHVMFKCVDRQCYSFVNVFTKGNAQINYRYVSTYNNESQKQLWNSFIDELDNQQQFSLCKHIDKLSLEDKKTDDSSSSSSSPTRPSPSSINRIRKARPSSINRIRKARPSPSSSYIHRILHWCKPSFLYPTIVENVRAPFIEVPRHFFNEISHSSNNIMALSFRFLPGQENFLFHDLKVPKCFEFLSYLSNSLSLTCSSVSAISYSSSGFRSVIPQHIKILVEVITCYNGWYGRFLVLVCLGMGCTVWYGFTPSVEDISLPFPVPADINMFAPFECYDPFFSMDYHPPIGGLHRVCFIECKDISETVTAAYAHSQPFAEINIPASGPVLKAVSLGVMIAFFISVGIVPDQNNVQI